MLQSLFYLFKNPYNKKYPFFALKRFIEWKIIKFFKLSNYKKTVWDDRKIYLNHDSFQSMWVMYNWLVDWEEFNLINDFVTTKSYCLDVGANMGFYTIWFSKFTKNIYAFEPDTKNYLRLNKNVCANNADEYIRTFNIAVGELDGEVSFTKDLDGENHIVLNYIEGNNSIVCKRLDSILFENKIVEISYLKIDVEGFELEVLKGLGEYISKKKIDIIQIEINKTISNSGSTVQQLLEFISTNDLQLCSYQVIEKQLKVESYHKERENYFIVFNINAINEKLSRPLK